MALNRVDYSGSSATIGCAAQGIKNEPTKPPRLTAITGDLDGNIAQLRDVVLRFCQVADRLGGSATENSGQGQTIGGDCNSVAGHLEMSLADLRSVILCADRIAERLEQL